MADKVTPASSLGKTREPAFEPTVGFNNSPQTDTIVDLISSFHMNEPPTLHSSIISPLRSIYCTQMVTIEVGPQKVPFLVHKGLICGHSKYFSAAFNGFFKEAATQSIHLTEEDPVAFEILHIWLYTERLTEIKDGQDVALSPHRCLDVYMLGDKFDMPHLCDAAINRISEHAVETQELSTRFIISSYERTCSDSQLCDFIVAVLEQNLRYNFHQFAVCHPEALSSCPGLLQRLMANVQQQWTSGYRPRPFSLCLFHRHKRSEPCPCAGNIQSYAMVDMLVDSRLVKLLIGRRCDVCKQQGRK